MSADPKSNRERPPWYDIEVSIVNSATETETKSVTIGSVLEDTRNGRWKIPVGRIWEKYSTEFAKAVTEGDPDPVATAKKAVNGAKKNLPGILWSGKFSGRANDKLESHSGVLGLDLDNLGERFEPFREKLKSDKHVQAFSVRQLAQD
jgi:VirE N-terminal domain